MRAVMYFSFSCIHLNMGIYQGRVTLGKLPSMWKLTQTTSFFSLETWSRNLRRMTSSWVFFEGMDRCIECYWHKLSQGDLYVFSYTSINVVTPFNVTPVSLGVEGGHLRPLAIEAFRHQLSHNSWLALLGGNSSSSCKTEESYVCPQLLGLFWCYLSLLQFMGYEKNLCLLHEDSLRGWEGSTSRLLSLASRPGSARAAAVFGTLNAIYLSVSFFFFKWDVRESLLGACGELNGGGAQENSKPSFELDFRRHVWKQSKEDWNKGRGWANTE